MINLEEKKMPCLAPGCREEALTKFHCAKHRDETLSIIRKHISEEPDVMFCYEHYQGCSSQTIADYLRVSYSSVDTILLGQVDALMNVNPSLHYPFQLVARALIWKDRIQTLHQSKLPKKIEASVHDDYHQPIPLDEASRLLGALEQTLLYWAKLKTHPLRIFTCRIDGRSVKATTIQDLIDFAQATLDGKTMKTVHGKTRFRLEEFLKTYDPNYHE